MMTLPSPDNTFTVMSVTFTDFFRGLLIIIPPIVILYWLMGLLEEDLEEKDLFISFVWGIFGGNFAGLFRYLTTSVPIMYLVGIPLLEESLKGIYVIRLRNSTELSLVSRLYIFGLAVGATSVYITEMSPYEMVSTPLAFLSLFSGALAYTMLHAANGGLIGLFTVRGKNLYGISLALGNNFMYKILQVGLIIIGLEYATPEVMALYALPTFLYVTTTIKRMSKKSSRKNRI